MIDSIASTSASSLAPTSATNAAASAPKATGAGTQDYFLKLLVAQMKNQDPLNPLDNAQVTSQLAQLNTVEGINKLATKLDALLGNNTAAQSLQAAALVGRTVMAPGTTIALQNGQAIGGIELTGAVDRLTVTVKDGSGRVVYTTDLGARDAGVMNFVWDGSTNAGSAATPGSYSFSVEAKSGSSKVVANTLSAGVVTSVSPGANGASLLVSGVGSFALSQIRQIY